MRFEWDENKNQINLRKQGFSFHDAAEIFNLPLLTALDKREDYGEDRWIGIGMLRGYVVTLIFSQSDEETIRIISLRKALKYERINYEKYLRLE